VRPADPQLGPQEWDELISEAPVTRSTAAACPSRSPTAMPPSSTRIEIPGATPASGSGGRKARLGDATWEGPVLAQVAGIALDDVTMASVVVALGST